MKMGDSCDVWNEQKIKIYELLCVVGKQLLYSNENRINLSKDIEILFRIWV